MDIKKITKNLLSAAIAVLAVVLVFVLWGEYREQDVYLPEPVTYTKPLTTADGAVKPQTITIPSLGIDVNVEHVGRDSKGRMAVPQDFENVGWYREGFTPGENGNAVIAGHLDDGKGNPAVFFHLEKLAVGESVLVEGEEGVLEYRITDKKYYDYNTQDTSEIFGQADSPRLTLITCDGTWLEGERTYDKRLVVFAELVR